MKTHQLRLMFFGKTLENYSYGDHLNPDEIVKSFKLSLNSIGRLLLKLSIFKIEVKTVHGK